MKKLFTLLTLVFIQYGFSQRPVSANMNYQILIESLPERVGVPSELIFNLENKGTYTFRLSDELVIPKDYYLIVKDSKTGNVFNLRSEQIHSFTINRTMSKQFLISMERVDTVTVKQKEMLNMLLL